MKMSRYRLGQHAIQATTQPTTSSAAGAYFWARIRETVQNPRKVVLSVFGEDASRAEKLVGERRKAGWL